MKKLRSKRGETMIESLVAIAIITLCFNFLFASIVCAARLNNAICAKSVALEYASGTDVIKTDQNGDVLTVSVDGNVLPNVEFHQTSNGYTYYD